MKILFGVMLLLTLSFGVFSQENTDKTFKFNGFSVLSTKSSIFSDLPKSGEFIDLIKENKPLYLSKYDKSYEKIYNIGKGQDLSLLLHFRRPSKTFDYCFTEINTGISYGENYLGIQIHSDQQSHYFDSFPYKKQYLYVDSLVKDEYFYRFYNKNAGLSFSLNNYIRVADIYFISVGLQAAISSVFDSKLEVYNEKYAVLAIPSFYLRYEHDSTDYSYITDLGIIKQEEQSFKMKNGGGFLLRVPFSFGFKFSVFKQHSIGIFCHGAPALDFTFYPGTRGLVSTTFTYGIGLRYSL